MIEPKNTTKTEFYIFGNLIMKDEQNRRYIAGPFVLDKCDLVIFPNNIDPFVYWHQRVRLSFYKCCKHFTKRFNEII